MSAHLYALSGPAELSVSNMSNFEAGLAFLGVVNQLYPGIKFGQLPLLAGGQVETMGFSLSSLNPVRAFNAVKDIVGDVKDGVGDVIKDTFHTLGDVGGSTVRLVTDEKVVDGATKAYTSYSTGGLLSSDGNGGALGDLVNFISTLGSNVKQSAASAVASPGGLPGGILPWAVGLGAFVFLLARRR